MSLVIWKYSRVHHPYFVDKMYQIRGHILNARIWSVLKFIRFMLFPLTLLAIDLSSAVILNSELSRFIANEFPSTKHSHIRNVFEIFAFMHIKIGTQFIEGSFQCNKCDSFFEPNFRLNSNVKRLSRNFMRFDSIILWHNIWTYRMDLTSFESYTQNVRTV